MTFEYINTSKLNELTKNQKIVLIDIRSKEEFELGHIENSQNISIHENNFPEKISKLDKEKEYIIYCRSGARTEFAKQFFQNFKKIYILENGLINYKEKLVSLNYQ